MEYEHRYRKRADIPEEKKIGSFTARLTACAIILCIFAGCKYASIGETHIEKLSYLVSYNSDITKLTNKIKGIIPKNDFKSPLSGTITTEYGGEHKGIDIAADENTPVSAAAEGAIIEAGENGGYGNCVQIKHADGTVTLYAHLNSISVNKGDVVKQGSEIGKVGSTGDSTGPHLHFEVIKDEKNINPKSVTEGL